MPTHWKKLTNPNYLGAYAFEQGEEKTGTIDYVKAEMVKNVEGKEEECIVCHFLEKNLKPLILNKTNCKTITKLYNTPFIENWAGKKITMQVKQVKAFGDLTDAVRIKNAKLSGGKVAEIKCADCGQVIKGMGQYGPEQVAKLAFDKYGRNLCVECGKKAKAALEVAEAKVAEESVEETPAEPENDLAAQLMAAAEE